MYAKHLFLCVAMIRGLFLISKLINFEAFIIFIFLEKLFSFKYSFSSKVTLLD